MHKIIYEGKEIQVKDDTRIYDLFKEEIETSKNNIIACTISNEIRSLNYRIKHDCTIKLLDTSVRDGMRTYIRGLTFIVIKAINDIAKDVRIEVNYAIGDAIYCNVKNVEVTEEMVDKINKKVKEIIEADMPFTQKQVSSFDLDNLNLTETTKERIQLEKNRFNSYINVYYLGDKASSFYGILPISTKYIKAYEIRKYREGILIRYPNRNNPNELSEYKDTKKLFNIFNEYEEIYDLLGVRKVTELNKIVKEERIGDLIRLGEALHEKKIAGIADKIANRKKAKIVLVAGPSSSGKTTFAQRLAIQLKLNGLKPVIISTDNYFVNREETPKDEEGNYDFESLYAVNLKLFNEQLNNLINGQTVTLPKFSFKEGRRKDGDGHTINLSENGVIIIEGIHCLNDSLTEEIPEENKFKIYLSALTVLNVDDYNRITTTDTRMMRRILRDNKYRGIKAMETLVRWPSVNRGEEKNIYPYQENADIMFNSSLVYEMAILCSEVMPLLAEVSNKEEVYSEAKRLYDISSFFVSAKSDAVPQNSILREFIGGSCFFN